MADIRRFLDISTGHLDPEGRAWCEANATGNNASTEYGWFLYVKFSPAEEEAEGVPASLSAIFKLARDKECDYVLLDRDATPSDELHWYEDAEGATA